MNPEEQETEAAHFELWQTELEETGYTIYLVDSVAVSQPSWWTRVGEMAAFWAVWSVILAVGVAFWVMVGAGVWWLVSR